MQSLQNPSHLKMWNSPIRVYKIGGDGERTFQHFHSYYVHFKVSAALRQSWILIVGDNTQLLLTGQFCLEATSCLNICECLH